MTYEKAHTDMSRLRSRDLLSIVLAAIASSPGYLALLVVVLGWIFSLIYGGHFTNPSNLRISHWLVGMWFVSTFAAMITVPISLILALVATFLPLAKRAKIIIWLVAVGGGLGWLTAARVVLGPTL